MSETLYVTPAQVLAAKLALELSEEAGEAPDEAIKAIANAQVVAPQRPIKKPDIHGRRHRNVTPPPEPPRPTREEPAVGALAGQPPVGERGWDMSEEEVAAILAEHTYERRQRERQEAQRDAEGPDRDADGPSGGIQR